MEFSHLDRAPFAQIRPHLEAACEPSASEAVAELGRLLQRRAKRLITSGAPREVADEARQLRAFLDSSHAQRLLETQPRLHERCCTVAEMLAEEVVEPTGEVEVEDLEGENRLQRSERGLKSHIQGKSFEHRVAELFRLLGYSATVDYKRDDMQFDVKLELASGLLVNHALVECKQTEHTVTQKDVRELASKVAHARTADQKPYQAILVSRSGFANNAHTVATQQFVQLLTFEQLLLWLVELGPSLEAAIAGFRGTALERLYVEQEVVLQSDLEPGKTPRALPLSETVRDWLERPTGSFLTLLGDFGSGKTSFCRRLACELALAAREQAGRRVPVLIDLREGGSTTVTLESLLTHHFQGLSSRAFNPQALLHLNREGYLVLFFDGFDEILGYAEPRRFLEILRQILRAAEGKAKVILTCRTHYFRDRPDEVKTLKPRPGVLTSEGATRLFEELRERPGAEVGYLREFSRAQIDEYLQKALPPPADWKAFRAQIARTYNLEDLAERPFLLEMIVKTLPRLEGAERVSIADLYEAYCASWFEKNDFRLTMTREVKEALVEYLARMIWDSTEQHVHFQVLAEKAVEFFRDRPLSVLDKGKVDYEVRTALFLHRNPEGYYAFIHRSFLEFFVARTLRKGLREGDAGCLALKRLTREVAFFLSFWPEAERIPALAGKVLEAPYQPRISENALLLLTFHARSQAMPLLGPGAEAVEEASLLQAREVFQRLRPGKIRLEGASLEAADLRAIDLSGARLAKAWLGRADLRQAMLERASLEQADLAFADLRNARLESAVLIEANLDHADARRASLKKADLSSADLSFARLAHIDLRGAQLEGGSRLGAGFLGATGLAKYRSKDTSLRLVPQLGHNGPVKSVVWSPDGRFVASGSNDGTLKLWDAASGALLAIFEGHTGQVLSVAWDPQGRRIASASDDKTVKIWNAADGCNTHTFTGHADSVRSVAWDPQGQRLASASFDQSVKIWNASDGRNTYTLQDHSDKVRSVAWNPRDQSLASASFDQSIKIWNASDGRNTATLQGHASLVLSIAWDPQGQRLASASFDQSVKIWNVSDGRNTATLQGHASWVGSVAWDPQGQHLASASFDQSVKIWNASDSRNTLTLKGHAGLVNSVAWDPHGQRLASASSDKTVKIWSAADGRNTLTLQGYTHGVRAVAWVSQGQRLISASADKSGKIWSFKNGKLWATFESQSAAGEEVARHSNGRCLATATLGGWIDLWDVSTPEPKRVLRLYDAGPAGGFAATPDGYVDGSPAALELVRYVENYAIYDLDDLPERHSPERIQAVLRELLGEP